MRDFKSSLDSDIKFQQHMLKIINREMKALPEGTLNQGKNGRAVYENVTKSLPLHSERAVSIAKWNLLQKKKQIIEENLRIQEKIVKKYRSYRDDCVLETMRPVYKKILQSAWKEQDRIREEKRIALQNQKISSGTAYHPEHLKHRNQKGEIIRSKSEYIFGMQYDSMKIPYSYEERVYWPQDAPQEAWIIKKQLHIPDFYIPDFTFTMPDGAKKYHEHLGMMDKADYMETWKKKMILYFWAGVIPGRNLIITADDRYGGIDMQKIMPILEAELGCLIGTAT